MSVSSRDLIKIQPLMSCWALQLAIKIYFQILRRQLLLLLLKLLLLFHFLRVFHPSFTWWFF